MRTFFGALSLFALLIVLRRPLRPPPLGYTIVIGLLQTTGFVGLLMWALESGGAGKTSVLTYTMPFWLLLLAWAFLGERLRGVQWLAVALALAGLVLVLEPVAPAGRVQQRCWRWPAGSAGPPAPSSSSGCRRRHGRRALAHHLADALRLAAAGAHRRAHLARRPEWTTPFVLALAYNVVLANALAWFLWLFGLRRLSAGAAGIATLATPVIGVAAAWIQLGERPSAGEAAGMALIIGALALVTVRGLSCAGRHAPRPRPTARTVPRRLTDAQPAARRPCAALVGLVEVRPRRCRRTRAAPPSVARRHAREDRVDLPHLIAVSQ